MPPGSHLGWSSDSRTEEPYHLPPPDWEDVPLVNVNRVHLRPTKPHDTRALSFPPGTREFKGQVVGSEYRMEFETQNIVLRLSIAVEDSVTLERVAETHPQAEVSSSGPPCVTLKSEDPQFTWTLYRSGRGVALGVEDPDSIPDVVDKISRIAGNAGLPSKPDAEIVNWVVTTNLDVHVPFRKVVAADEGGRYYYDDGDPRSLMYQEEGSSETVLLSTSGKMTVVGASSKERINEFLEDFFSREYQFLDDLVRGDLPPNHSISVQ